MRLLGVRCSSSDYSFAILDGTRASPKLILTDRVGCPKGYSRPATLKWFLQEIEDHLRMNAVTGVAIKGSEAMAMRNRAFVERIEIEAMTLLAAANADLQIACRKVKSTIAKDLGLKGKAKYLAQFDTSALPEFDGLSANCQEAALVAWSCLPA